ncbi:hypothetical protein GCM10010965_25430 [Caldalkalibacillus thermarum]|uniref:DUF6063 family protein n=1 Tax=Caldalkalibacillus thermarum TaxID=296745 RepID=UPI00166651D0|nr:DUF6063 family protein [Caldalkalibacillus thermarum]GGK31545.1 hypothetical protein GCM10010965_25430 [Caldalkalibacillus thermarum]
MVVYEHAQVMKAFEIYALLAQNGVGGAEEVREYLADDHVRSLVDQFARKVDCVVITAGDKLFLIPETKLSPFHVKNETLKRTFLGAKATNTDLYMMYFAIIVFFGEFYDSYTTMEATRDFLHMADWVSAIDKRIQALKEHDGATLREKEQEYDTNWQAVIDKWDAMDDIKETSKKQSGNTISRFSFVDSVRRFLEAQELAVNIGNNELQLTEKAKTIVQRYYMDLEYNRDILAFMYQHDQPSEETAHTTPSTQGNGGETNAGDL